MSESLEALVSMLEDAVRAGQKLAWQRSELRRLIKIKEEENAAIARESSAPKEEAYSMEPG